MGTQIIVDTSDLNRGIGELLALLPALQKKATSDVAEEILRLSGQIVPLGKSAILQDSGQIDPDGNGKIVGYNAVYAAYQHEGMRSDGTHVVRRYSHPRSKRKYLENPIKENMSHLLKFVEDAVRGGLS